MNYTEPYLIVLGIAQDAGYPQAGCKKPCCQRVWNDFNQRKLVTCLGVIDPKTNEKWFFEATPDFIEQLQKAEEIAPSNNPKKSEIAGIFITHAHIGHYTGLMHLGREAIGAKKVPVYVMPKMQQFLTKNGPWDQLVKLENISFKTLKEETPIKLNDRLQVVPFLVPHRGEYSETVGFTIIGPNKKVIFIPDIDKWSKWNYSITDKIQEVDAAFLDGTFYENGEIPGRDMSKIPHPFIQESMDLFETLSPKEKAKIHFIHLNHTNPALIPQSNAQETIEKAGLKLAKEFQTLGL